MCIYICVCVYVCAYVHVCVRVRACVSVYIYVCINKNIHIYCMHNIYTVNVRVHDMCTYQNIRKYVCMCMHSSIKKNTKFRLAQGRQRVTG